MWMEWYLLSLRWNERTIVVAIYYPETMENKSISLLRLLKSGKNDSLNFSNYVSRSEIVTFQILQQDII